MRHIFICGSKSIGQYGGYETFVDKLSEYTQGRGDIQLHIACKANGEGYMDESKLANVTPLSDSEFVYHNAHCFKIRVPDIGSAVAIYYDTASVRYCIHYCKKHGIRNPIIYILTCRIGPFIGTLVRQIKKLGGQYFLNPDGHEWARQKWSPLVRRYWKWSERLMVKRADLLVCDSKNIERYILSEYARYSPKTTFISYGADVLPSEIADDDPRFVGWLQEKGLELGGYYLVVGRFVPENNYETMLREFMRSDSKKSFALIANVNDDYLNTLEERLHFRADPRVKFVGTVYDRPLLKKIRENAFAYLHGHEVGGTNPSLLEALASTNLNLLLDVGFNREVGETAALYWTKEPGNLAGLIHSAERLPAEERARMGEMAKARIRDHYSWQSIADHYDEIWNATRKEK